MLPDQSAVYYPEELSLLGQILDQAVQSLPPSMRTPQNRAAIAKDILACAATGERDPIEIGLAALINLKARPTPHNAGDAQALGIGGNRAHCLRGSLEQEIVDDGLVLVGDGGNPRRQREYDVEVRDVQQF
jgi:hypothetical protein